MTASLVCVTLEKAVRKRKATASVISHSVRQLQEKLAIVPSYSKLAYPWDNAVTESFFNWLKQEELKRHTFSSLEKVKLACFNYIEGVYNPRRPHSAINRLSPNLKEEIYWQSH